MESLFCGLWSHNFFGKFINITFIFGHIPKIISYFNRFVSWDIQPNTISSYL